MAKNLCRNSISFCFIFILISLSYYTGKSSPPFACNPSNAKTSTFPFCISSLQISDRVEDLIGRLTLHEKVSLLANNATAVERLGIKGFEWWSEGLHGVAKSPGVQFGGDFPGATSFPQVITTVSSFNASLWEEIGRVVSNEARAMYNGGKAGLTLWSPNVNIFRDPRWGRGQETAGEDPFVAANYAVRFVRGLQGAVGNKLKVAACCKHFTAYDLENWNGIDRYHFNAKVSKQDLEETFNVPFKACILEGKVASIMCSYNQVNGRPTCADPTLLRDTIRDQWRLNGYIVSDCDSVDTFFNQQHYTSTPEDAVAATIKAGLDLDCGPSVATYAEQAIRLGKITESDIDRALANTLTVQMRLGMFDGPRQPYLNLGPKDVCTPAHKQLALEAARQGIVLLQNPAKTLPLATTRYATVAVIGPHSDATQNMLGNYAGVPCCYTSPLQGIEKYANTIHQTGCIDVACNSSLQFEAAEIAAHQADVTVLVMGLDQSIEAEEKDRLGLLLPGLQQDLVSRVAKVSRGPTILVLISGSPVDVAFAKHDPRIAAILWAGYPGQAGGNAIADIIFGRINPGAKLPMTWYPQDFVTKVPMTKMDMRADPATNYPGRTYKFYKGPVVFPFGFGLSYTDFKVVLVNAPTILSVPIIGNHDFQEVAITRINCDDINFSMHFDVKNVGEMDGSHSFLVFAKPPTGENVPEKQLVAFEKVHVFTGDQRRIRIDIDVCKQISVVDQFGIRILQMGVHSLRIGDLEHFVLLRAGVGEIMSYK